MPNWNQQAAQQAQRAAQQAAEQARRASQQAQQASQRAMAQAQQTARNNRQMQAAMENQRRFLNQQALKAKQAELVPPVFPVRKANQDLQFMVLLDLPDFLALKAMLVYLVFPGSLELKGLSLIISKRFNT